MTFTPKAAGQHSALLLIEDSALGSPRRVPLSGVGVGGSSAPRGYIIQDLGTLNGDYSVAAALNNAGQVVGEAGITGEGSHAFFWSDGQMQDLGTFGGHFSQALSINSKGQVVGLASVNPFSDVHHAFLWEDGRLQDLGTLGGLYSVAYAINDAGQVVGRADTYDLYTRAFLWSQGHMRDLGVLPLTGYTVARGINAVGQIVGYANGNMFFWSGDNTVEIGTLGGRDSSIGGLNDLGEVVGASDTTGGQSHAFRRSQGRMQDLGALGGDQSFARAINNRGEVVGWVSGLPGMSADVRTHAFLYTEERGMVDLNAQIDSTLGWILLSADGINDRGQIAGTGYHHGRVRAFVLTP